MKIARIYNNNVILARDMSGNEVVVIGKGLAFNKKVGDSVDKTRTEKIFTLQSKNVQSKLAEMMQDMPSVYLEISDEIVKMIRKNSDLQLNEDIYLTLTDHISVSLRREKEGIVCTNPLLPEIRQFYVKEFHLAEQAVDIIENYMHVRISEDEIGFITLHIVNSSMNQQMHMTMQSTRMISAILEIISSFFQREFDPKSAIYRRLLRHLQIFTRKLLSNTGIQENETYFYNWGRKEHGQVYECVRRIEKYVEQTTGKSITKGEQGYLILHIVNLIYS